MTGVQTCALPIYDCPRQVYGRASGTFTIFSFCYEREKWCQVSHYKQVQDGGKKQVERHDHGSERHRQPLGYAETFAKVFDAVRGIDDLA